MDGNKTLNLSNTCGNRGALLALQKMSRMVVTHTIGAFRNRYDVGGEESTKQQAYTIFACVWPNAPGLPPGHRHAKRTM